MTNQEIADIFRDLSLIFEYKGESFYKVKAYRRAYKIISKLQVPISKIYKSGKLRELKGIGSIIEAKIEEIISTGELKKHQHLLSETDPEILDILRNTDVAPRVIRKLADFWGKMSWKDLKDIYFSGRMKEAGAGASSIKKIETALKNKHLL